MNYYIKLTTLIFMGLFLFSTAHGQTETSKTIIVDTVPSGADVEIIFYQWGDTLESKTCKSPCLHQTKLDRSYYIKIKKEGYAYYSLSSKNPYNISSKTSKLSEPEYVNDLHVNGGWLSFNETNTAEKYKIILETEPQQSMRIAKIDLAKKCPVIFKKHFVAGNRPARHCELTGPATYKVLQKKAKKCDFKFDITINGFVSNIRNVKCDSTTLAKELENIEGKSGWNYFPAIKNGEPVKTIGLTFSLEFSLNSSGGHLPLYRHDPIYVCPDEFAKVEDDLTHDTIPCKRVAPSVPSKLKGEHYCHVSFNVTVEGKTKNVKPQNCSHKLAQKPSKKAVSKWLYVPRKIDGVSVERKGVISKITFKSVKRRK